jgi:hypothetical protein
MVSEKDFLALIKRIRTYVPFVLPTTLIIGAVCFFYWWVGESRSLFLVSFLICVVLAAIAVFVNYSRVPKITKRAAGNILIAFSLTFFFAGYFFYQFNHRLIKEADLKRNLQNIERRHEALDDYFKIRLSWISALTKRLWIAESNQYPALCREFFENHPADLVSIYFLNRDGVSAFGVPFTRKYKEETDLKRTSKPEFVDPSFEAPDANSSVKLVVPFFTPDSVPHYFVFILRLNDLAQWMRETYAGTSLYLEHNGKIIFSNSNDDTDSRFNEFQTLGYFESPDHDLFITRNNLHTISWQTITVQSLDEAYPNVKAADEELTKVVLLGVFAGMAAGFVLLLYLNVRILSPLSKLSNDAAVVFYKNFEDAAEFQIPVNTDEYSSLSVGIKVMAKRLKDRTTELAAAHKKIEAQWEAAHKIEARLLPPEPLNTSGFEIYGKLFSAPQSGGRYFDYFEIDEDHVGILLIEAAGQDMAASFFTALIKSISEFYIRFFPKEDQNLRHYFRILEEQFLAVRDQRLRTVAVVFAVLNTANGLLKIINAGFEGPLLIRNGSSESVDVTGRAMGAPPSSGDFGEMELALHENDWLLVHSKNLNVASRNLLADKIKADNTATPLQIVQSELVSQEAAAGGTVLVCIHRRSAVKETVTINGTPDSEAHLIETLEQIMTGNHFSGIKINEFKNILGRIVVRALKLNDNRPAEIILYSYPGFVEVKIQNDEGGINLLEVPEEEGGWEAIEKSISDWSFHTSGKGSTLCLRLFET